MRNLRFYVPSLRKGLLPGLVWDLNEARRFAQTRGLKRGRLTRYRAACFAHLHLLPAWVDLSDGIVTDVGANVGDWTAHLLTLEPSARVIAVEPNPGPLEELRLRFANDERVDIESCAVSCSPGTVSFHVTGHSHNASLRRPRAEIGELYGAEGAWEVVETIDVEATTVDSLTNGQPVSLLKIDVQGAELDVLAGAEQTLSRTASVLLEVNLRSHYHGDASFPELHGFMTSLGFELVGLSEPFATERHRALWADACYVSASRMRGIAK